MSIFVNQGLLVLTLNTETDISGASVLRILYKTPQGATGYFTGTLSGTTKIQYQMDNDDLSVKGIWKFQAYVEIGGLKAWGKEVQQEIKIPIQN
jgi:hypothetical protein